MMGIELIFIGFVIGFVLYLLFNRSWTMTANTFFIAYIMLVVLSCILAMTGVIEKGSAGANVLIAFMITTCGTGLMLRWRELK